MRIFLTAKQWASKGPRSVSAKIRQRKSKRVRLAKGQPRPMPREKQT